jgi:putative selenate reductase molybdopterin-binding subunit
VALSMGDTIPPHGHFADAHLALAADGQFDLAVGSAEFGNGTSTVHTQTAASVLGTLPSCIRLRQSDTDAVEHDTGVYGSTGTVVAGTATLRAAEALRTMMLERGASLLGVPAAGVKLAPIGVEAGNRRVELTSTVSVWQCSHRRENSASCTACKRRTPVA